MSNQSSSMSILIRMVSYSNIFNSHGSIKGLGSESTFEVVRHFYLWDEKSNTDLIDPRKASMICL